MLEKKVDDWEEDWYKYTEIEKELTDLEYERRCAEIQNDIDEIQKDINKIVDKRLKALEKIVLNDNNANDNQCYEQLLISVFDRIESELLRLYDNKYQKPMDSPFRNTGNEYSNNTFSVRAYYWGDDEECQCKPNFKYKDFEAYWYKHSHRGLSFKRKNKKVTAEYLNTMLTNCLKSLYEDDDIGETYENCS